jgi:hypothetical protein
MPTAEARASGVGTAPRAIRGVRAPRCAPGQPAATGGIGLPTGTALATYPTAAGSERRGVSCPYPETEHRGGGWARGTDAQAVPCVGGLEAGGGGDGPGTAEPSAASHTGGLQRVPCRGWTRLRTGAGVRCARWFHRGGWTGRRVRRQGPPFRVVESDGWSARRERANRRLAGPTWGPIRRG